MTEAAVADANATSVQDAGISSVLNDISEPRSANADAISIVDDEPGKVAGAKTDADGKPIADDKVKADGVKKDGQDGKPVLGADGKPILKDGAADDDRFDKHPRFQELIQGRKEDSETIKNLSQQLETVMKILGGKTPEAKEVVTDDDKPTIPYKDITGMTKEQLLEWQEDDPHGYAANLYAQMLHEARTEIKREQMANVTRTEQETRQESIKKTYLKYAEKNPDFNAMWKSGEIQKFMDENPGHNAISAHRELTLEKVLQTEREKTARETEERVTKNFKAKRNAQVLDGGGGRTPAPNENPELVDTKQHGGLMSVLASRLKGMRTASG